MSSQSFETTVERSGSRVYIVIPFDPNEIWGVKYRHYVTGSVHGRAIRGSIDSDGTQYSLPLGPTWRRDNGVDAGAHVEVILAPEGPRSDNIAPDIVAALDLEPQARTFFDSLATFYRNNYMRWIESAKRPETRAARIAEMMGLLIAGKKQR